MSGMFDEEEFYDHSFDPNHSGLIELAASKLSSTYRVSSPLGYNSALDEVLPRVENSIINDQASILRHSHDVKSLLKQFIEVCHDQSLLLSKLVGFQAGASKNNIAELSQQIKISRDELDCWSLLDLLLESEQNSEINGNAEEIKPEKMIAVCGEIVNEIAINDVLCKRNASYRKFKLIVKWCEESAALRFNEGNLGLFNEKTFLWENSLHALKSGRKDKSFISEMDPDAPIRANTVTSNSLISVDAADEGKMLMQILALIRCGDLQKAIDLCVNCGQSWRAATLMGSLKYQDNNIAAPASENTELVQLEGNPGYDMWKSVCWQLAEEPSLSDVERSIYGALSGHLRSTLLSCTSWQDCLWAYCRAASEQLFDSYKRQLLEQLSPSNTGSQLQTVQANSDFSLDEIFTEIEANPNQAIAMESQTLFCEIFKHLCLTITNDELIDWLYQYLESIDSNDEKNANAIRLAAHLAIVFLKLGNTDQDQEIFSSIDQLPSSSAFGLIEIYLNYLHFKKQYSLLSIYTSKLPLDLQIRWYSKFCEDFTDLNDRKRFLEYANDCELNVLEICRHVVETIRRKHQTVELDQFGQWNFERIESLELISAGETEINEFDTILIGAIDWLLFYPELRFEALKQANAISRQFIILRKYKEANLLLQKLPLDTLDVVSRMHLAFDCLEEREKFLNEFMCLRAFLDCVESFHRWFNQYYRRKPADFDSAIGAGDEASQSFTEQVNLAQRRQKFTQDIQRWERDCNLFAEDALSGIFNVLKFPGGWLRDNETNGIEKSLPVDDIRRHQIRHLRQLCIPLVTSLALHLLKTTGKHQEAIQIVDLIGDEDRKLYEVFGTAQLQDLLAKISDCCIDALDSGKDSLGFNKINA